MHKEKKDFFNFFQEIKYYGILFTALIFFNAPAQTIQEFFPGSSIGYAADTTSDGGFILTGYSMGSMADVNLIKMDNSGAVQWSKQYGGCHNDHGRAAHQLSDGGYIIAGRDG